MGIGDYLLMVMFPFMGGPPAVGAKEQRNAQVSQIDQMTKNAEMDAQFNNSSLLGMFEQEMKSATQKINNRSTKARRARASIMAAGSASGISGGTIQRTVGVGSIDAGKDMQEIDRNADLRNDKLFLSQTMDVRGSYYKINNARHGLPNNFTQTLMAVTSSPFSAIGH